MLDQHIAAFVARGLRQRGVDVLTANEAERCGLSDADQLRLASRNGRVVVTFDPDYLTLAAGGINHAGVAYCRARKYRPSQLLHVLLALHGHLDREDMANHVEFL